jgi:hypothetical protein
MSVFDSFPTTPLVVPASQPLLDEAHLAAGAFLARYRVAPWTPLGLICVRFSSGPPRSGCFPFRQLGSH